MYLRKPVEPSQDRDSAEKPKRVTKKQFNGRGFDPADWQTWPGKLLALKGWRFDGETLISPDGEIVRYDPLTALGYAIGLPIEADSRSDDPAVIYATWLGFADSDTADPDASESLSP